MVLIPLLVLQSLFAVCLSLWSSLSSWHRRRLRKSVMTTDQCLHGQSRSSWLNHFYPTRRWCRRRHLGIGGHLHWSFQMTTLLLKSHLDKSHHRAAQGGLCQWMVCCRPLTSSHVSRASLGILVPWRHW